MATKIEDWMCGELEKLGIPASYENAELVNYFARDMGYQ